MLRTYRCRRDPVDERDIRYSIGSPTELPPIVDLSTVTFMPSVLDQGQSSACTAHAISNAFLFVHRKEGKVDMDYQPSRLFIYYNERSMEGTINEDSGAVIRDGIKSINQFGVCHENLCPFLIEAITVRPSNEAFVDVLNYKALSYKRISNILSDMKGCLAEGYPFVVGIMIYEALESEEVARTGILPMPAGQCLGGHAVMVVGYDDVKQMFKIMNSWGSGWGDHGYFYVPYAYLESTELANDLWTIRLTD